MGDSDNDFREDNTPYRLKNSEGNETLSQILSSQKKKLKQKFETDKTQYRLKNSQSNTSLQSSTQVKSNIQKSKVTKDAKEKVKEAEIIDISSGSEFSQDNSFMKTSQKQKKRKVIDESFQSTSSQRRRNKRNLVPDKNQPKITDVFKKLDTSKSPEKTPVKIQPKITDMFRKINLSLSGSGDLDDLGINQPICSSTPKKSSKLDQTIIDLTSPSRTTKSKPKSLVNKPTSSHSNKQGTENKHIGSKSVKSESKGSNNKSTKIISSGNLAFSQRKMPTKSTNIRKVQSTSSKGSSKVQAPIQQPIKSNTISSKENIDVDSPNIPNILSCEISLSSKLHKNEDNSKVSRTATNNFSLPSCITVLALNQGSTKKSSETADKEITKKQINNVPNKPVGLRIRKPEEINLLRSPKPKTPMKKIPNKKIAIRKPADINESFDTKNLNEKDLNSLKRPSLNSISSLGSTPTKIPKLNERQVDGNNITNQNESLQLNATSMPLHTAALMPKQAAVSLPRQTFTGPRQTLPVPKFTCPVPRQTVTVSRQTAPVPGQTAPMNKQNLPVPRQTVPVPRQTAMVHRKTVFVPRQAVTVNRQTVTVPRQTIPVPRQTAPVPRQAVTVNRQTVTVPRQTIPVPRQTVPVPRQTVTVPRQTVTVPRQTVPVPKQTVTVPRQAVTLPILTVPVSRQTVPLSKQTFPVPRQTVSVPRESVSLPKQTVPVPTLTAESIPRQISSNILHTHLVSKPNATPMLLHTSTPLHGQTFASLHRQTADDIPRQTATPVLDAYLAGLLQPAPKQIVDPAKCNHSVHQSTPIDTEDTSTSIKPVKLVIATAEHASNNHQDKPVPSTTTGITHPRKEIDTSTSQSVKNLPGELNSYKEVLNIEDSATDNNASNNCEDNSAPSTTTGITQSIQDFELSTSQSDKSLPCAVINDSPVPYTNVTASDSSAKNTLSNLSVDGTPLVSIPDITALDNDDKSAIVKENLTKSIRMIKSRKLGDTSSEIKQEVLNDKEVMDLDKKFERIFGALMSRRIASDSSVTSNGHDNNHDADTDANTDIDSVVDAYADIDAVITADANVNANPDITADANVNANTDNDVNTYADINADINADFDVDIDAVITADANVNADAFADADVNADVDADADINADSNADVDANADADINADVDANANADIDADITADSDADIDVYADDLFESKWNVIQQDQIESNSSHTLDEFTPPLVIDENSSNIERNNIAESPSNEMPSLNPNIENNQGTAIESSSDKIPILKSNMIDTARTNNAKTESLSIELPSLTPNIENNQETENNAIESSRDEMKTLKSNMIDIARTKKVAHESSSFEMPSLTPNVKNNPLGSSCDEMPILTPNIDSLDGNENIVINDDLNVNKNVPMDQEQAVEERQMQGISKKTKVKHKGKVYEISLEPTPTNSQNMDQQENGDWMIVNVNSQTDQQDESITNDTKNKSAYHTTSKDNSSALPTSCENKPQPSAYEVVLQKVQDLEVSGRPVVDTAMLLGDVKKILENESSAFLRIGDNYSVLFDLKQ